MTRGRQLTPEERAKPYAKYYDAPLAEFDSDLLAQLRPDAPIDPALALAPERINDLLDPGYHEVETGWCVLDNGAGYVAVNMKMPGVTVEMVDWWYAWHGLEDLRYMLWFPPGHLGIRVDDETRAKILDPSRSLAQKYQGLTHHVHEDVGGGPDNIDISFLTPEDLGFDMARFKPPAVATVVGGFGWQKAAGAPPDAPPAPAIMLHFVREIDGGVEYRTRFWMGYTMRDRKPVCLLPPEVKVPWQAPFGLSQHCVQEYSNLRAFLPSIFGEEGPLVV